MKSFCKKGLDRVRVYRYIHIAMHRVGLGMEKNMENESLGLKL